MTYVDCPLRYFFQYRATLEKDYENSAQHYQKVVQKVILNFYSTIQNQEEPRLSTLKRSWGTWWIQKKTAEDVLYTTPYSWREGFERLRKLGIEGILTFWETFKEPGYPLAINQTYHVPLTGDLTLTGTWDIIREIQQDGHPFIQILFIQTGNKKLSPFLLQHDLRITASSYAFYSLFKKREDTLLIYSFDKGRFYRTKREKGEYTRMKETVLATHYAIEKGLFYPSPSERCEHCPYKTLCKDWLERRERER